MKNIILFSFITVASGLMLTNMYTSLIDARSWGAEIPQSLDTARQYFNTVNPGNFFRIFSPLCQILGLLTLIIFWRTSPTIRAYLGIAFVLCVMSDVLTFAYFYPRNDILFKTAQLTDIDLLRKTWAEWSSMNWVRSFIGFVGLIFSFLALHKIYNLK